MRGDGEQNLQSDARCETVAGEWQCDGKAAIRRRIRAVERELEGLRALHDSLPEAMPNATHRYLEDVFGRN